jgi:hypothetical protein
MQKHQLEVAWQKRRYENAQKKVMIRNLNFSNLSGDVARS